MAELVLIYNDEFASFEKMGSLQNSFAEWNFISVILRINVESVPLVFFVIFEKISRYIRWFLDLFMIYINILFEFKIRKFREDDLIPRRIHRFREFSNLEGKFDEAELASFFSIYILLTNSREEVSSRWLEWILLRSLTVISTVESFSIQRIFQSISSMRIRIYIYNTCFVGRLFVFLSKKCCVLFRGIRPFGIIFPRHNFTPFKNQNHQKKYLARSFHRFKSRNICAARISIDLWEREREREEEGGRFPRQCVAAEKYIAK